MTDQTFATEKSSFERVWGSAMGLVALAMVKQRSRLSSLPSDLRGTDASKIHQAAFSVRLIHNSVRHLETKWTESPSVAHRAAIADVVEPASRLRQSALDIDLPRFLTAIVDTTAALSRFEKFTLSKAVDLRSGLDPAVSPALGRSRR